MIIPQKEDLPPPVPSGSRPPSYQPSFPFAHEPATTAREKTEERYVYYRVYHPSGAVPCHTAFSSDPFLGRLRARSIPPPHTVATLKRCIRAAEGYEEAIDWLLELYDGFDALEAMSDGTRMAILSGKGGNGMGVETALVLLLPDSVLARSTPSGWTAPSQQMLNAFEPFVYYRLYTQTSEDTSILALSPSDPSLGRISTLRIAPPYTLLSLLRCIASPSAEDKPWYSQAAVFPSMDAVDQISLDAPLNSLPGGLCDIDGTVVVPPGTTEENPLILVCPSSATNIFSTEQGNQNQNSTSLLRRARTELIRQRAGMAAANNHGAQPLTRTVRWQGGMLNDRPVRVFAVTAGAQPRVDPFPFIGQSRPSEAVDFNPTPFIASGRQPEVPPADSPATGGGNNAQTPSEKRSNEGTTRYHRDPPMPMPPPPPAGTAPPPFPFDSTAMDEPPEVDSDLYLTPRLWNANLVVGVVGVGGIRGGWGRGNARGTRARGLRNPTPFIANGRQPEDPRSDSPATGEDNNAQTPSGKHSNEGTTRYHRGPPMPAATAPPPFPFDSTAMDEPTEVDSDFHRGRGGVRGRGRVRGGWGRGNATGMRGRGGLRIHQAPAK